MARVDRVLDAALQFVFDVAIGGAAQRHDGALLGADDARHHRHVVTNHVMKHQRLVGLIDQSRNMTAVHRLVHVDQFAFGAQALEELAIVLGERGFGFGAGVVVALGHGAFGHDCNLCVTGWCDSQFK